MTTNPRDIIADTLNDIGRSVGGNRAAQADWLLDALCEADYVIVKCGRSSRVVVSRESKPCPEVYRSDLIHGDECERCGGSGVVEATTTYGLAVEHLTALLQVCGFHSIERTDAEFIISQLAAVALPEETQQ